MTASKDHTARVWKAATGEPITPPLEHKATVWTAQFNSDNRRVVTATGHEVEDNKHFRKGLYGLSRWLGQTNNPDDSVGEALVWDAEAGQRLFTMQHSNTVTWAAFSPDGRRVVTACVDGTARVWDAVTGQPVTAFLPHLTVSITLRSVRTAAASSLLVPITRSLRVRRRFGMPRPASRCFNHLNIRTEWSGRRSVRTVNAWPPVAKMARCESGMRTPDVL